MTHPLEETTTGRCSGPVSPSPSRYHSIMLIHEFEIRGSLQECLSSTYNSFITRIQTLSGPLPAVKFKISGFPQPSLNFESRGVESDEILLCYS